MTESVKEISVPILLLEHAVGPPVYASDGAAGADLLAAVPEDAPLILAPGARAAAPTGVALALPEGYEAQIRPRSGLALKYGVAVANAPGTIDWDYRGEIKAVMVNLSSEPFAITRGLRIAQMVIAPVTRARFTPAASLDETTRGVGGFGSTGLKGDAAP